MGCLAGFFDVEGRVPGRSLIALSSCMLASADSRRIRGFSPRLPHGRRMSAFGIGRIDVVCAVGQSGRSRGSDLVLAMRPGWTHFVEGAGRQPHLVERLVRVMRRAALRMAHRSATSHGA